MQMHTNSVDEKELEGKQVNTLQYIRCTAIYYITITSSHLQGKMSPNCVRGLKMALNVCKLAERVLCISL